MENNNQKTSENRTESFGIGLGPLKTWAKGSKPLKVFGWGMFIALGGYGIYRLVGLFANKGDSKTRQEEHTHNTNDRINLEDAKSKNTINEHHEASKDTMAVDDNRTDNEIRKAQVISEIRVNERKQMMELRQSVNPATAPPTKTDQSLKGWIDCFHAKFPVPDYSSIPILASVLDGCPDEYKDSVMMSLLSAFGALSFSKVRAPYLDNKLHSPSIQVIVEGKQGSGKGNILHLNECLFYRVIAADMEKLTRKDTGDSIIQTAGINISQAKFYEVMANNQGVHIYAFESEVATVEDAFRKSNGLSFDFLRKAFHNEKIYLNNMSKSAMHGAFPVFFNYTFTGTPKAIASLINDKQIDGGTASRICFAVIPELSCLGPSIDFPSGSELDNMQDQIDAWRQKYCFQTVDGRDVACPEYDINIDYVCDALQDWYIEQYNLSVKNGVEARNDVRMRAATIAHHCAIVLHMLAGEPQSKNIKLRRTVKNLAVYIANYCMERYLSKFTDFGLQVQANETTADSTTSTPSAPVRRRLTQEEIDEWYCLRGTLDENGKIIGLGTIAKKLGVDKYSVKNSFDRYERRMGLK